MALTWGANASVAGLNHYDVDVSTDNRATWSPVVANTTATSASYTAQQGQSYVFRVIVTDNLGRTEQAETGAQGKRVTKYYAMAAKRVAMRADNVVYYLHADHLGSTSLVTNASGQEVPGSRTGYLPFGQVRYGGTLPTDFTYTGQRADATGLMYFRARYYSSSLGRFLSADTIVPSPGNPQSLNRYSYVLNSPLKFIDPTGHHEECDFYDGCGQEGTWSPPPFDPWVMPPPALAPAAVSAEELVLRLVRSGYQKTAKSQAAADVTAHMAAGFEFLSLMNSSIGTCLELGGMVIGGGIGFLASLLDAEISGIATVPGGMGTGLLWGNNAYRNSGLDANQWKLSGASTVATIFSDYLAGNSYTFLLGDKTVLVVGDASAFSTAETIAGLVSPSGTADAGLDVLGTGYAAGGLPWIRGNSPAPSIYDLSINGHMVGGRTATIGNLIIVFAKSDK